MNVRIVMEGATKRASTSKGPTIAHVLLAISYRAITSLAQVSYFHNS